ncbi:MAG: hypothetical protein WEB58_09645, partial [Planctomycetaceae bacterium]
MAKKKSTPTAGCFSGQWIVDSHGKLVMTYERFKKLSGLAGLAEIDGLGREGVSGDKNVSGGGAVRTGRSTDRIQCSAASYDADELKRRILLILNMNRIVQHIWEAIRFENTSRLSPVFDSQRPIMSTADMRQWYTSRPCERTTKSHINVAAFDGRWEASEAYELEHNDVVEAWVKNDHLGFEILYVHRGVVRKYRPDFLIRLALGTTLILEVKGQETDETKAKHAALAEWVQAVNDHGGFGRWAWGVSRDPADVVVLLARIAHPVPTQMPPRAYK